MTDERLENILGKSMPQISPSAELNQKIIEELEDKKSKRLHGKRIMVLAIACTLMLSSITVMAAAIHYYTVTTTDNFYTKDYRKMNHAEELIGCEIKFLRKFTCGFSFEHMEILNHTAFAMEESGEVAFTEDYASVEITYSGDSGYVTLNCWNVDGEYIDANEANVRNIAGIDVEYRTIIMDDMEGKKVIITPVDGGEVKEYTLTREDITSKSARWIQDGVYYLLLAMGDNVTEEEMFSMVEELITSQ